MGTHVLQTQIGAPVVSVYFYIAERLLGEGGSEEEEEEEWRLQGHGEAA